MIDTGFITGLRSEPVTVVLVIRLIGLPVGCTLLIYTNAYYVPGWIPRFIYHLQIWFCRIGLLNNRPATISFSVR